MNLSKFQIKKKQLLRIKAIQLYKEGLTTREVGAIVGKSHQWVATAVKGNLSTGKVLDKTLQR